jgi:solute carrier family 25 carnitine/acylcarnitine transporter 20/29
MSLPLTYAAGGMAGLTNSVISGPMEHIRIRLQIQSSSSPQRVYTGVRDCVRGILQQAGPAGLYRGQSATMLREFHSYGIWFSVYDVLLSRVMETEGKRRDEIASWKIAGCGALTGEVLWAANYPFDVVKSKMQADGFGAEQRYCNMRDVIRQTWRTHGFHGFFRGLGPTLLRALPVSAGTFAVYAPSLAWLYDRDY